MNQTNSGDDTCTRKLLALLYQLFYDILLSSRTFDFVFTHMLSSQAFINSIVYFGETDVTLSAKGNIGEMPNGTLFWTEPWRLVHNSVQHQAKILSQFKYL